MPKKLNFTHFEVISHNLRYMLLELKIDNFKSLKNTTISFSKNTFLIGVNGAGKTSILQAVDFLSAITSGKVEKWLINRGWDKKDLTFYKSRKSLIDIRAKFSIGNKEYIWEIAFNSQNLRCTKESIYRRNNGDSYQILLNVNGMEYRTYDTNLINMPAKMGRINFIYTGSILSVIKPDLLGEELNSIREYFCKIRSAELLSPILMKKKAKESNEGIGLGGEKLSAFINGLSDENKNKLQQTLKDFYPNIDSFKTKSLRSGWKTLSLIEKSGKESIETDSMHLSDGILRILAILSQLLTTESILIFDEIEDGINQEFVEKLVDILSKSPHQTIVATHSPLLLNYIEDEIAKKSILFVYKRKDGSTKVVNFFEILAKYNKISDHEYDLFGPGEIMQSVNLLELTEELLEEEMKNENSN